MEKPDTRLTAGRRIFLVKSKHTKSGMPGKDTEEYFMRTGRVISHNDKILTAYASGYKNVVLEFHPVPFPKGYYLEIANSITPWRFFLNKRDAEDYVSRKNDIIAIQQEIACGALEECDNETLQTIKSLLHILK